MSGNIANTWDSHDDFETIIKLWNKDFSDLETIAKMESSEILSMIQGEIESTKTIEEVDEIKKALLKILDITNIKHSDILKDWIEMMCNHRVIEISIQDNRLYKAIKTNFLWDNKKFKEASREQINSIIDIKQDEIEEFSEYIETLETEKLKEIESFFLTPIIIYMDSGRLPIPKNIWTLIYEITCAITNQKIVLELLSWISDSIEDINKKVSESLKKSDEALKTWKASIENMNDAIEKHS